MADLPEVPSLAVLEPPPGGLARLQATLDGPPRRRRWWLAAPAISVLALVAVALWLGRHRTGMPTTRIAQPELVWVTSQAPRSSPPANTVVTVPIERAPQVTYLQLR